MVLQRDKPIAVWGWADPGEKIEVRLANGAPVSTQAGTDSRWGLTLQPLPAGGPFVMRVAGKTTVVIHDVMIGDVWVLSGQSNMTFPVSRASNASSAISKASNASLRLFTVPDESSLKRSSSFQSAWQICTPENAKEFSAVAYFFGSELEKRLQVPIGLIHSSWPGTSAEEWTDSTSLAANPDFAPILSRWRDAPDETHMFAGDGFPFDLSFRNFVLLRKGDDGEQRVAFSDFSQANNQLGGKWTYSWNTAPESLFEIDRAKDDAVAHLTGRLRPQDSAALDASLAEDGQIGDLSDYSGIEFSARGSGFFQLRFAQPTVTDEANYASPIFKATREWRTIRLEFSDLKQPDWGVQLPWTPSAVKQLMIALRESGGEYAMRPPSGLYNGMIAPLAPFSIRGFVWYQGEGNAGRAYQYRELLPALIQGWRKAWNDQDLPFLIVQLPNHGARQAQPVESAWAELREAQLQATRLPHTAIAVTIDVGEADNVHPADKADVGDRLALLALGTVYGQHVAYSGPVYGSAKVEQGTIRVHFRNTFGGLKTGDGKPLTGFELGGADRRFAWANAKIEGDDVVVSSPGVPNPVAVRYAWADNPVQNLTNSSGIPASPFRTDDWSGITVDAK